MLTIIITDKADLGDLVTGGLVVRDPADDKMYLPTGQALTVPAGRRGVVLDTSWDHRRGDVIVPAGVTIRALSNGSAEGLPEFALE